MLDEVTLSIEVQTNLQKRLSSPFKLSKQTDITNANEAKGVPAGALVPLASILREGAFCAGLNA